MSARHEVRRATFWLGAAALLGGAVPASAAPVALPDGGSLPEVRFERHVAALLGRAGCNAGACHGSFQGKGGLYLSLFGYAPDKDFQALTRTGLGRLVDRGSPDRSLLLLKATGQVPHGGGQRFARGSWEYQVFREWIAGGALPEASPAAVRRIAVEPAEHCFGRPGERVALRVNVEFADGTRADLTPFCDFRAKDDAVAEVSRSGVVRGLRPGDTPVIVGYRGHLAAARVLVPVPERPGVTYPGPDTDEGPIDRAVSAKLRRLRVVPSGPADDAEFLRRLTIDTTGSLPTPDEVRAFLADTRPDKRSRKVDALLARPLHAALWATKFCDITANNLDALDSEPGLRAKQAKMWHDWFRRRFADNTPYDQIARGVLCATSRDGKEVGDWIKGEVALHEAAAKGFDADYASRPSLDMYWRRTGPDDNLPLEEMAERTAAAFLGVRVECAQCHKHPYDRWTQVDYRAFANVFARVRFDISPETRAAVARMLEERRHAPPGKSGPPIPRLREVYVDDDAPSALTHPETGGPLSPRALGGPEVASGGDAREELYRWLVRPDNPFFARTFVNRVWAHYFGVGLVEPVDNFSVANPPSNEPLLDLLARDFAEHGYDVRRLERAVLTSHAYQRSSAPNPTNAGDRANYARAYPRRMMAEVVLDVLDSALGAAGDFGSSVPPGARAVEAAPSRVGGSAERIFRVFGRPVRKAVCDCERPAEPALPQTLFLMSDPGLLARLEGGRLKGLLASGKSDGEVVDELFLATLSRPPDGGERQAALEHVKAKGHRKAGFAGLLWALVNTREFILNH
jgi:hypothetical protein